MNQQAYYRRGSRLKTCITFVQLIINRVLKTRTWKNIFQIFVNYYIFLKSLSLKNLSKSVNQSANNHCSGILCFYIRFYNPCY